VPASTSNLGAGFDCFGLALQLYLTVRATRAPEARAAVRVRMRGEAEGVSLARAEDNLIVRAMRYVAVREGLRLAPVRLAVRNEIPPGRGLGSSAAAVVSGLTLGAALGGVELSTESVLRYAAALEGHADNAAACLLGGWVVTATTADNRVLVVKRPWPADLKVLVVSPRVQVATAQARAALPREVPRAAAVSNLQRAALFGAALAARRYDLLWEAMQDRLHQEQRQALVPGLAEALALPRRPGLVGLALSGAGPSVVALVEEHAEVIGAGIAGCFERHGIETATRLLAVDEAGRQVSRHGQVG
jgi:homoserine kinase